ncbi:MAG: FtsQ-type POTRA domain-containing protein [Geobacteraceae bacterium]|nr:FtsQ-type POTRA domain-containing protein [Geobacteraceae bacterium]
MRDMHYKKKNPQQNRNRQKRERKPRRPLQFRRMLKKAARVCTAFFVITLVWILGTESYEIFADATFFKLERIEVPRLQQLSQDEIVSLAGVKLGESLLKIDLQHVAEQLEKNPWVEKLKVRRRFPGTLSIEITERVPVAVVNMGYLYYLDSKGEIFKPLTEGDRLDYPVLTGISEEDLLKDADGTKIMLTAALGLMEMLKKGTVFRLSDISEIHLDKGYGYTLFTTQGGIPVKLGNSDFQGKLTRFSKIYQELMAQIASLEYVDLNYPDKIVVKKV